MGKPRLIILIRHAQSEGNKNRDIHQFIPDHRVKLTPDGQLQAEEAGRRLRSLLKPDDTIQFFTSPYRRTRETTEGILRTLTSDEPTPTPFPRNKITVFEEPRLREQDFGNFQPCSAEMERMWQERADYGHFFYRIPNGESAADAYDRISGFNESLWRQFGDEDFPSVCVLVTHGLMTRVFLMKWYHWSVEYFEDLRNVNHCEFITMQQSPSNGKYILQNQLRTWSELKKRAAATINTEVSGGPPSLAHSSPVTPHRRWGGCANGCNHDKIVYPRKIRRQNTAEYGAAPAIMQTPAEKLSAGTPVSSNTSSQSQSIGTGTTGKLAPRLPTLTDLSATDVESPLNTASTDADGDESSSASDQDNQIRSRGTRPQALPIRLHPGRDFGGSRSGAATPIEGFFSDDSDFFPDPRRLTTNGIQQSQQSEPPVRAIASVLGDDKSKSRTRSTSRGSRSKNIERRNSRKKTEAEWAAESGMGSGARADALGDGGVESEMDAENVQKNIREKEKNGTIHEGNEEGEKEVIEQAVEEEKIKDRKSFSEVY